jgi:hypothetical protein
MSYLTPRVESRTLYESDRRKFPSTLSVIAERGGTSSVFNMMAQSSPQFRESARSKKLGHLQSVMPIGSPSSSNNAVNIQLTQPHGNMEPKFCIAAGKLYSSSAPITTVMLFSSATRRCMFPMQPIFVHQSSDISASWRPSN